MTIAPLCALLRDSQAAGALAGIESACALNHASDMLATCSSSLADLTCLFHATNEFVVSHSRSIT
jgi:hypothetical protein